MNPLSIKHTLETSCEPKVKKQRENDAQLQSNKRITWYDCIKFYPVRRLEDLDKRQEGFPPLFLHQMLSEKETLQHLRYLRVSVFVLMTTLDVFIQVKTGITETPFQIVHNETEETCTNDTFLGSTDEEAEKFILEYLLKQFQKIVYPGIFYTDLKTFQDLVSMQKESSIYGYVVHKFYSVELNMKRKEKIQVSLCKMEDIGKELSPQYQYHRRMEWFMHFFCDACSNIEWDDHWTIFFIYRELEDQKWECIGMVSTFNFFCLPKNRERLSQFFIFPFAQGYGIGTQTLLFIHRSILADPTVGEFNVEKPGDSFSQMRQVVDTLLCLEKVNLHSLNPSMESPSLDRQKPCFETFLNESFYRLLQSELKITKNQAQHVAIVLSCRSILPKSSSRRVINDEPNVSHEPRGWKQVIYDDILALADSNDLKELRIFVKKRLRRANLEVISQLPAERQRALLNLLWCQSFSKYCRVAYCVERYAQLLVCRKVDHENK